MSLLIDGLQGLTPHLTGNTLAIHLPWNEWTVDRIKDEVSQRLQIDSSQFHLTHHLSPITDARLTSLQPDNNSFLILHYHSRVTHGLLGGKGGFGSLLRTATTKVGTKKTNHFGASRDLSGRRMRHVEAEQKIAEWNAQEHEPINQQELNKKYKAIKDGKPLVVQQCKWGATCKYRYSTCRREHPPDPNAEEMKENGPITTMPVELSSSDVPTSVRTRDMQDAVSAGLQRTMRKRKSRSPDEKDQSDDEDNMQDDLSLSDDEDEQKADSNENDRPKKRAHLDYLPSAVPDLPAAAAATSSTSTSTSFYARSHAPAVEHHYPVLTHRPPELSCVEPEKAALGLAAVLAQVKQKQQQEATPPPNKQTESTSTNTTTTTTATATAAISSFSPIDLSTISSPDDLVTAYPLPHLTHELQRVGLKAGGTHQQRAERLFLLKNTTIDKLPNKVRAAS